MGVRSPTLVDEFPWPVSSVEREVDGRAPQGVATGAAQPRVDVRRGPGMHRLRRYQARLGCSSARRRGPPKASWDAAATAWRCTCARNRSAHRRLGLSNSIIARNNDTVWEAPAATPAVRPALAHRVPDLTGAAARARGQPPSEQRRRRPRSCRTCSAAGPSCLGAAALILRNVRRLRPGKRHTGLERACQHNSRARAGSRTDAEIHKPPGEANQKGG